LQQGHSICAPVQLVYDGSSAAQRAVATAAHMASITDSHLIVTTVGDTPDVTQRLQGEIEERLQAQRIKGDYRQLIKPAAEELAHALRTAGGGTLIISADNPLLQGEGLLTLLDAIDCSVCLVR